MCLADRHSTEMLCIFHILDILDGLHSLLNVGILRSSGPNLCIWGGGLGRTRCLRFRFAASCAVSVPPSGGAAQCPSGRAARASSPEMSLSIHN